MSDNKLRCLVKKFKKKLKLYDFKYLDCLKLDNCKIYLKYKDLNSSYCHIHIFFLYIFLNLILIVNMSA